MSVSVGIIIFVFKEYNSRNQAGLMTAAPNEEIYPFKDLWDIDCRW